MAVSSPESVAGSSGFEMLTPRSKVAKMLAEIDNAPSPPPPTTLPHIASNDGVRSVEAYSKMAQKSFMKIIQPRDCEKQHKALFKSDSTAPESSDSDDAVRWPQGKAARRMKKDAHKTPTILKMEKTPAPSLKGVEEDDLYSSTPLRHRKHGSRLPSNSPVNPNSGGLFVSPGRSYDEFHDTDLPENPIGSKEKLAELVARKREERLRKEADEIEDRRRRIAERRRHVGSPMRKSGNNGGGSEESTTQSIYTSYNLTHHVSEGEQQDLSPEIERIMSDSARPTRKATKKALIEMERETQRLARQQALAHQMKVKKKFTTSDLLSRFNKTKVDDMQLKKTDYVGGFTAGPSSTPNSDAVDSTGAEPTTTPPSSPPTAGPTPLQKQEAFVEQGALSKLVPVREDSIASIARTVDLGENKTEIASALRTSRAVAPSESKTAKVTSGAEESCSGKCFKIARLAPNKSIEQMDESDDEDLEIIAPLPPHLQVFERTTKRMNSEAEVGNKAFSTLLHLSRMDTYDTMPRKGNKQSRQSIGLKTLEMQLRKKAKEQARRQQLERIAELKAKGIDVQTAEEREIEAEVFDNLLEKARLEAQKLRKVEMAIAQGEGGDDKAIEISDDEDEDYDYEVSGSEEEELLDEGDKVDDEDNELVLQTTDESDRGENDDEVQSDEGKLGDDPTFGYSPAIDHTIQASQRVNQETPAPPSRKLRQSHIIVDDDDEESYDIEQDIGHELPTNIAQVDDDPFAAFNFGANDTSDTLLSPTQAFQATMQTPTQATQEESFDILRRIAPPLVSSLPPTIPDLFPIYTQETSNDESQRSHVPGSQVPESQRVRLNWEMQQPETPVPVSLSRVPSAMSETPGWEPTQDEGLPSPCIAGLKREITSEVITEHHETQDTVPLRVSESPAPSKTPPRKRKLVRRRAHMVADDSDGEMPVVSENVPKRDVFKEMARRRASALTAADVEEVENEIKRMMDEQAEESEDEYAGLGGDDFVAPETEEDRAIIDTSYIDVDGRALAAHFAERERKRIEEETNRLYKDLTTGALRRKQANAWGLEEDENEIALRRRQMRQQEEARKRKLLLQDEHIAGLAQGKQSKGKDAFLKAIADEDDGDDLLNLSDAGEDDSQQLSFDSQNLEGAAAETVPLREVSGNKRRLAEDEPFLAERPAAKQRRTQFSAFRKPASMHEVRESLSFLLDEPDAQLVGPTVELSSDSDGCPSESENGPLEDESNDLETQENARQNDGGYAPNPAISDAKAMPPPLLPASQRRTAPRTAVVDRLSLRRSATSYSTRDFGRTAWAAPASGDLRVPSLLRRATSNMTTGTSDRGISTPILSRENSGGVKKGGSKNSSLAYQARAEERRAIVEASARRREENTARIAEMRRNSSALGSGLTGRFE